MKLNCVDRLDDRQIKDLHRLYHREWWTDSRELADVKEMLEHTDVIIGYTEPGNEKLVAFARVLTDRVYKALVLDVIVADSHRSTGLGKVLMQAILGHPRLARVRDFELYCRPELVPFYRRMGFDPDPDQLKFLRLQRAAEPLDRD